MSPQVDVQYVNDDVARRASIVFHPLYTRHGVFCWRSERLLN